MDTFGENSQKTKSACHALSIFAESSCIPSAVNSLKKIQNLGNSITKQDQMHKIGATV